MLHRDRRRRFASLEAARRAKAVKPVPMLRASEIRVSGKLEFERQERPDCFIDVGRQGPGLVTKPAIALHRVSSHDQDRRLICAPVPRALQSEHGGVLGENHVNFLVAINGKPVHPALLARILRSGPVDRLFRCRSGATNVSVYELTHLPFRTLKSYVPNLPRHRNRRCRARRFRHPSDRPKEQSWSFQKNSPTGKEIVTPR